MKFLTIILTFTILFFSVKPAIELISFQTDSEQGCCADQCPPVKNKSNTAKFPQQNDGCSGISCTPFEVCSNCMLQCDAIPYILISKPEFLDLPFSYKTLYSSQFIADFWQPPKMVTIT